VVGFSLPTINLFTAIGRPRMGILLSLMRQLFILIPAYLVLTHMFGFTGFWFAMPLAEIVAGLLGLVLVTNEFKALKLRLR
ncbi:MAG: MATE family efflux transporter, partial [Defluviitaleaceae bacterium]|nr:MATE family efflux transporter [Defluviitaleaceae bacterium]